MNNIRTSFSTISKSKVALQNKNSLIYLRIQSKNKFSNLIKTNSYAFSGAPKTEEEYFFKKQEYDRAFKFLSEEMKDVKSILIYSRKFPYYPTSMNLKKFSKLVFYNSIFYLMFANGIYNFNFFWVTYNAIVLAQMIAEILVNSKKVSSIFLIKTKNDFTNETDFYFIVGYGFLKKVQVINLLNFHSEVKEKIEKELFLLEDSKIINLGFNIQFVYWYGEILIINREIFKFFFKQERQQSKSKKKNDKENEIDFDLEDEQQYSKRKEEREERDSKFVKSMFSQIFQDKHH